MRVTVKDVPTFTVELTLDEVFAVQKALYSDVNWEQHSTAETLWHQLNSAGAQALAVDEGGYRVGG